MRTGLGDASTTVTGISCPCSLKNWVMPTFFPMIPIIAIGPVSTGPYLFGIAALLDLDLDVHTSRQIQLRERIDCLGARIEDIDYTLVRLELELLARFL